MNSNTTYIFSYNRDLYYFDMNSLNYLYQFILKAKNFKLYLFLLSEAKISNSNGFNTFYFLMNQLNLNLDFLIISLKKLIKVNLVSLFFNPIKNVVVIKFKKPLSYQEFVENKNLYHYFFESNNDYYLNYVKKIFSYDDNLITKNFKEIKISNQNNLNLKNNFSNEKLNKLIAQNNKFIQLNNTDNFIYFEMIKNEAILEMEKEIILNLKNILSQGPLNCLLEYVYKKNNQQLNQNYILKIANSMAKKNINTTLSAMNFLRNAYNSITNSNNLSFSFDNDLKKVSNQNNDKELFNLISKI